MQRIDQYNNNEGLWLSTSGSLETFITNVKSSGNFIIEEAVRENFNKIPFEWRKADRIYIAGAWNVGNILGYDQSGSIISMPFSRDSVAYANRNFEMYECGVNIPCIDNFFIKREYGIVLKSQFLVKHPSSALNGTTNSSFGTLYNSTNDLKSGWTTIRELNGFTYENNPVLTYGRPYVVISGTIRPSWSILEYKYISLLFDTTELRDNGTICIFEGTVSNQTHYNIYGESVYSSGNISKVRSQVFYKDGRRYLELTLNKSNGSNLTLSAILTMNTPFNTPTIGSSSNKLKFGWFTYGNTLDELENSVYYRTALVNNSTASQPVREEDTLTINLTQTSDIFINTSKGIFEFKNQPVGLFDYKSHEIIDCKIYNICIRYV